MPRILWMIVALALLVLAGCSGHPAVQSTPAGHDREAGRDAGSNHGM